MRLTDRVLSVLPPPASIAMDAAGVDISGESVKCVSLKRRGGGRFALDAYRQIAIPEGAVVAGEIQVSERLVEILRTLRLRFGVRFAHASLPGKKSQLYQTIVPVGASDFRASIATSFKEQIPLPEGEVVFDFEPMRTVEAGTVVSVTVCARRIVDTYTRVFQSAGITLLSLEAEGQSLARATLSPSDKSLVIMIVDFGTKTTRIAITEHNVVACTETFDAEVDTLAPTLKKHLADWKTSSPSGISHIPVEKIIFCGSGANLRGFAERLEGSVGVPVSMANVWGNAVSLDSYIPPMPFPMSLEYATAIGLAERNFISLPW
ncbi:pilus assembly protein PilM [Candidatus Kaiserbacteria bacterium]|nr:pilus assembly protein PilM [Candidatus Kaiserbacteria bacterium]